MLVGVLRVLALGALLTCGARRVLGGGGPGSNIVLIVTDDQDQNLGGMTPMKKTKSLIGDAGATFVNSFTVTPLCCPSRCSILTGRYPHNHLVRNNSLAGNCSSAAWQSRGESDAFPVFLSKSGYQTFFAGKYSTARRKRAASATFRPGGTSGTAWWATPATTTTPCPETGLRRSTATTTRATTSPTSSQANRSLQFLDNRSPQRPFFLMLAPPAPHSPWTAAPQYRRRFADVKAPREGSFDKPAKDKHWLLRQPANPMANSSLAFLDDAYRKRWQTLLSVDDLVETLVRKLEELKELNNTYVVFTSDNGYHTGQFSLPIDKRQLYEFDIRTPLLVRGPGVQANVTLKAPVLNIDLAPTILDIAGINASAANLDGRSFLPLMGSARPFFLVEHTGEGLSSADPSCPEMGPGLSVSFVGWNCRIVDADSGAMFPRLRVRGLLQQHVRLRRQDAGRTRRHAVLRVRRQRVVCGGVQPELGPPPAGERCEEGGPGRAADHEPAPHQAAVLPGRGLPRPLHLREILISTGHEDLLLLYGRRKVRSTSSLVPHCTTR